VKAFGDRAFTQPFNGLAKVGITVPMEGKDRNDMACGEA